MFEGFCYHGNKFTNLLFYSIFRTTAEVSSKLYFLKYVKSRRNYGFLITKELIFGFQILDLKEHFSASLMVTRVKKQRVHFSPSERYSKSPRIRNSVFANQAVQFLVHETVFQIEAGLFLKCHIRNSLILQGFYCQEPFCHAISLNW